MEGSFIKGMDQVGLNDDPVPDARITTLCISTTVTRFGNLLSKVPRVSGIISPDPGDPGSLRLKKQISKL